MISKNIEIGETVWAVYHPRNGYYAVPQQDFIQEVDKDQSKVILQSANSLNDETDTHWTNDYYGNLVGLNTLYNSYEEAASFLLGRYEAELSLVEVQRARYKSIIADLKADL
jgi:hypothetical protein